jgi:hypothetical protein
MTNYDNRINFPTTPELNAFSSLAAALDAELYNRDSEVMRNNKMYAWSATHHKWLTLDEFEDLTALPVNVVTPDRFADLPQNEVPMDIVQTVDGETYSAAPQQGVYPFGTQPK